MKHVTITALILLGTACYAQDTICSTSWTRAFAAAAGISDVETLAPADMPHPSEYELTVQDIVKIKKARLFVYAGYEQMMKQVKKALRLTDGNSVQITTQLTPDVIRESVMKIAGKAGNPDEAENNIAEIEEMFSSTAQWIGDNEYDRLPVIVQFFQEPMARALGLNIQAVVGPAPLNAGQIADLNNAEWALVIDNIHNPVLKVLTKVRKDAVYILLSNFPGGIGDESLKAVIGDNLGKIKKSLKEAAQ